VSFYSAANLPARPTCGQKSGSRHSVRHTRVDCRHRDPARRRAGLAGRSRHPRFGDTAITVDGRVDETTWAHAGDRSVRRFVRYGLPVLMLGQATAMSIYLSYIRFVRDLSAQSRMVVSRVEKSGVAGSEGPDCSVSTLDDDFAAFRAGLKAPYARLNVDTTKGF
jgi:hypothetical protein